MASLAIVARSNNSWAADLVGRVRTLNPEGEYTLWKAEELCGPKENPRFAAGTNCVYVPSYADRACMVPDLCEAREVFQQLGRLRLRKLILLSSALIYGTGTARQSLVAEDYSAPNQGHDQIAGRWKSLEALAMECLSGPTPRVILRPTTVVPSPALLSRRLMSSATITLVGHDPNLQLLSLDDLAQAVLCASRRECGGLFNVAADGVVPFHAAIKLARGHRLALPRTWQRLARSREVLDYLRYPWTVSSRKIKDDLGFAPRQSSAEVASAIPARSSQPADDRAPAPVFDEFGMDRRYIESLSRTIFKFLARRYWRIEATGLENIPAEGGAVLVGIHRGFMPWDAVMALHLVLEKTGRIPRYLTHPGLLKFPFIANFITRLGGVVACQESADRILARGELLGVFPEGVQGAFAPYREAYQVRSFKRHDFVKMALRHRAPIIPYVTVGSAEAYPIFAQVQWRRWMRYTDWPCLPISTFPFLPFPLPTKWHIQFLPAIRLEEQYPEATQNPGTSLIKRVSQDVRDEMQGAVDSIAARRRSWFWGSVFQTERVAGALEKTVQHPGKE